MPITVYQIWLIIGKLLSTFKITRVVDFQHKLISSTRYYYFKTESYTTLFDSWSTE